MGTQACAHPAQHLSIYIVKRQWSLELVEIHVVDEYKVVDGEELLKR